MSRVKSVINLCSRRIVAPNSTFRIAGIARFSSAPPDQVTHTGQHWEADDYRLARFVDRPKQVNPSFAIELIDEVPPKACEERVVFCDGGGGPLGHPKIYINLDKPGNHACGYCGLRFTKVDHH